MSRLKKNYEEKIREKLQKQFDYKNKMLIPALKKIVINMGVGEATKDKNMMESCFRDLMMLAGQKPIKTLAKKSVANFKIREKQPIGIKVTLRRKRMYDFIDRFCNIVSPRIRDFRGFSSNCDGRGNYSLGLDTQEAFPEVNLDEAKQQGMHITFVTSACTDEECRALLRELGLPFKEGK